MLVRDLMRHEVVCCARGESLADAAGRMWVHDIGAMPVVDEDGGVVGMLTDRDIAMAAMLRGTPLGVITVGAVTGDRPVWTVHEGDRLDDAEDRMARHQVRRLPVVDTAGRLVGLLSLNDIADAASDFTDEPGLSSIHVTRTLRAISGHRAPT